MAVLETIRVKLGVFITVLIALALLSFIIDPNTLSSVTQSMSSKYNVGKIDGKNISYQDFQSDVETYTKINEIISGGSVQSDAQQQNIRNAAWQALIDKNLFIKNAKAAGIFVGEAEMLDLTTGENISPVISQNPAFFDETGNFSSDRLVQLVQNVSSDQSGQLKLYWDYLQNTVLTQQYYAKYGSLFNQSNFTNSLMAAKAIEENNNTTAVDFVLVPYGFQMDSTIVVSDSEIKAYYKNHKDFYKQQEGRDIEYVLFEVVPSAADIAATNEAFASSYDEFATTDNMKGFLLKNSDSPLTGYYYKAGELSSVNSEVKDFVDANGVGAVSPVYTDNNTFYAAKVLDAKNLPDSVFVRHILLAATDGQKADSLITVLKDKKASFSELASQFSLDQNSSVEELGEIGWMTQNYMIPGFESIFDASVGKPFILDTQYGKHIVEVTKTSAPVLKKQVAVYKKEALASKETFNDFYSQANTLATKSNGKYDLFKKAAEELGLSVEPYNNMLESTSRISTVDNAKEVTRWAFEQKKQGVVSNIITVNNNYFFIVAVTGTHKEGYASVSEVAPAIKNILYVDKMGEKKAAEVAEKIQGMTDLEQIAEALGSSVSSKDNLTFASITSPQNLDPKFIGAASVAKEGEISAPLAGSIGVYVFKVTGRDTGSYYSEDDAKVYESQKNQYASQMILPVMMDDADVIDHRARFF